METKPIVITSPMIESQIEDFQPLYDQAQEAYVEKKLGFIFCKATDDHDLIGVFIPNEIAKEIEVILSKWWDNFKD